MQRAEEFVVSGDVETVTEDGKDGSALQGWTLDAGL